MNRETQGAIKAKNRRPNRYIQAKPNKPVARSKPSSPRNRVSRDWSGLGRGLWKSIKLVFSGIFLLVLIGSLSVGLVVGYYYLIHSDYFMVRRVVLTGLDRVTREQILSKSGLDQPSNILAVNLKDMGLAIKAIPWVQDVVLTRKLPDTIMVEVKERRPRILINLNGLYYLDHTGTPFKKVDAKENPQLPIITGFQREDFLKREKYTQQDLEEVFELLSALSGRNDCFRLENISEVNFDSARGLSLFTREGNLQVKVGLEDYRAKMRRLGRVLAHLKIVGQSDGIVYFNLESSPRVIVRRAS